MKLIVRKYLGTTKIKQCHICSRSEWKVLVWKVSWQEGMENIYSGNTLTFGCKKCFLAVLLDSLAAYDIGIVFT